ncbi:MAG TPA: rRNA maturation RNase YbeY [Gammaproteobacteria bacterium]|nr:rRNA maturation RNase YbeY [Gammaproteobacteria bacterium]
MTQAIHIQKISKNKNIPSTPLIKKIATQVLKNKKAEITIRIINKKESAELNHSYRDKNYPTNVLSFVYETNPIIMGDIVLCAQLIPTKEKWAHLIVHGLLHLMGYDHETDKDAKKMESLEIKLLHQLGFGNPYKE